MVNFITDEEGNVIGQMPEQGIPKPRSKFKKIMGGLGNEVRGFHQMMLKKKAEASARNARINQLNKRGKKQLVPDFNINHAHEKIKVGW